MRKIIIHLLLFVFITTLLASCASSRGWDVNDTWRPKQHKRYDFNRPPRKARR